MNMSREIVQSLMLIGLVAFTCGGALVVGLLVSPGLG